MRRAFITLLLVALLGAVAAAPSPALAEDSSGGDPNAARAENRESGSSVLDFAFAIRRVAGDTVDQTNTATAYASCETCQTVAIAIQVVLVTAADPSTITPTNVAVAINEGCTTCVTFAAAYQFVVGTGGPVEFTEAGERELERVQEALAELRSLFEEGKLTVDEVKEEVAALTARVEAVLEDELVPIRPDDEDGDDEGADEDRAPDPGDRGHPRGEDRVPLPPESEGGDPDEDSAERRTPGRSEDGGQGDPEPGSPPEGDAETSPPATTTTP